MSILEKAHEEMTAMLAVVGAAREVEKTRWFGIGSQRAVDHAISMLCSALSDLDNVRASQLPGGDK